jgi:hypothetical protein
VKRLVIKKKWRVKRVKIKMKNLGYKNMILIIRREINNILKSLRKIKWTNNEAKLKRKTTEKLRKMIYEYYKFNLKNKWKQMWSSYLICKGLHEQKKTKHSTMKYKTVVIMKLNNDKIFEISANRNDTIEKNNSRKIFAKKKEINYRNRVFYNNIKNSEKTVSFWTLIGFSSDILILSLLYKKRKNENKK